MHPTRFVSTWGLLLVLGLAGSMVGCGTGAEQVPTAETKERIKEASKSVHQQLKEERAGATRGKLGGMRKGAGPG